MGIKRIVLIFTLLLLPLLQLSAEATTIPCKLFEASTPKAESSSSEHSDNHTETTFTAEVHPMLSTTATSGVQHSITPAVRTLHRTMNSAERQSQHIKATGSIDSTTAAARYGLYNHKILFVSHSRHYYLNRLVRLII